MIFNLIDSDALCRVLHENLSKQVLAVTRQVVEFLARLVVIGLLDVFELLLDRLLGEGEVARHKRVKDHAQTPDVARVRIRHFAQDFGRGVLRRPTHVRGFLSAFEVLG